MMINAHNYESYLLDYVDGELSETEQELLLAYVAAHPELEEELQWLQKTKPETTENLVFPGRERLYRTETAEKKALIIPWKTIALALAAAACLLLVFRIYQQPDRQQQSLTSQKLARTTTAQPASPEKTKEAEPPTQPAPSANKDTIRETKSNNTALLAGQAGESQEPAPAVQKRKRAAEKSPNSPMPARKSAVGALAKIEVQPLPPHEAQDDRAPIVQSRPVAPPEASRLAVAKDIEKKQRKLTVGTGGGSTATITSTLQKLSEHKNSLDSSFTDKLFALQQKVAHPIRLLNIQKIKIGRVSFVFNKK